MDWTQIIIGLISAVFGGGLTAVFLLPQSRKSKELENEQKAIDQWREAYERSEQESIAKQKLIDRVFADYRKSQERAITLSADNVMLRIFKCDCINCPNRKPPMGSGVEILKEKDDEDKQ